MSLVDMIVFFFFQAEDGIRDGHVTGVQTCALPISQFLPIGHYTIVAEAKGFKKAERRGVTLNVNDKLTLNFTLEPGAVTETVTVEADASPIELQTATASGLITGTEIRE